MSRRIAEVAAAALACAVCLACLLCLGFSAVSIAAGPKRPTWLRVESPAEARRGEAFRVRVELREPRPGLFLQADLHGLAADGAYLGYVSGTAPLRLSEGQLECFFDIPVPERADLAAVSGLVYLSAEGNWESRIEGCSLQPAPVGPRGGEAPGLEAAEILPLYDEESPPRPVAPREESAPILVLAALLLAASAVLALSRGGARLLGLACLAAAAWEAALPLPEEAAARLLRALAAAGGWYWARAWPQLAFALGAALALAAAAAAILAAARRNGRLELEAGQVGILAYACVAAMRIVSQHDVDAILSTRILGIQAGQALRLCCAALCLVATAALMGEGGRAAGKEARAAGKEARAAGKEARARPSGRGSA